MHMPNNAKKGQGQIHKVAHKGVPHDPPQVNHFESPKVGTTYPKKESSPMERLRKITAWNISLSLSAILTIIWVGSSIPGLQDRSVLYVLVGYSMGTVLTTVCLLCQMHAVLETVHERQRTLSTPAPKPVVRRTKTDHDSFE